MRKISLASVALVALCQSAIGEAPALTPQRIDVITRAALPSGLALQQKAKLDEVIAEIRAGGDAERPWREFVSSYFANSTNRAKLDSVVNEGIVRPRLDLIKAIRDHDAKLHDFARTCKPGQTPTIKVPTLSIQEPIGGANPVARPGPTQAMTCNELAKEIAKLDEKQESLGADRQSERVDFQANTQKQQQLMQVLSRIVKMLHAIAQDVISNIAS